MKHAVDPRILGEDDPEKILNGLKPKDRARVRLQLNGRARKTKIEKVGVEAANKETFDLLQDIARKRLAKANVEATVGLGIGGELGKELLQKAAEDAKMSAILRGAKLREAKK